MTCIVVLNPRRIGAVINALEALDAVKCWVSNYTEPEACEVINRVIAESSHEQYVVISDDCVPTSFALDKVLELSRDHACATGYCNLDIGSDLVNLTLNELPPPPPRVGSYEFLTQAQVNEYGDDVIPTTFAGLALTCMTREMWLRYPLAPTKAGGQIDYDLSYRLAADGHGIVSHRAARCLHLKEEWNKPDRNPEMQLLVGVEPACVGWS